MLRPHHFYAQNERYMIQSWKNQSSHPPHDQIHFVIDREARYGRYQNLQQYQPQYCSAATPSIIDSISNI